MTDSRLPVKEAIVLAACECIERRGLQSLTTRNIAGEAGVNIATIHCHFGTKQKLVEEALRRSISHAIEHLDEILQEEGKAGPDRLAGILRFLPEGAIRFPNITRAYLYDVVFDGKKRASSSGSSTPFSRGCCGTPDRLGEKSRAAPSSFFSFSASPLHSFSECRPLSSASP